MCNIKPVTPQSQYEFYFCNEIAIILRGVLFYICVMKTKTFDKEKMQKASLADVIRMWQRLWGDLDPSDVAAKMLNAYMYGMESLDETQQ